MPNYDLFSVLVVSASSGDQFRLYATTAMSSQLARRVLDLLSDRQVDVGEFVKPSAFPMGLHRVVGEAQRERARSQREQFAADQHAKRSPDYDGRHL